jgi:PAS domain S-box-containing protein
MPTPDTSPKRPWLTGRQIRDVLNFAPEGFVVVDEQGRITAANQEICRLFDYDRRDLIGQPVDLLIPERLRNRHERHRQTFGSAPKTCRMGTGIELYGRRRDGSEFPIEMHLRPIDSSDGLRVIGMLRDVTEEKDTRQKLEAQLAQEELLLKELHHRVHNDLQVLSSQLNLRKQRVDVQAQAVLDDVQLQIRAIALVHETLERTGHVSHIDLADYIDQLTTALVLAFGVRGSGIRFEVQVVPAVVRFDRALLIGRILHEAVANSVEHAFGEGPAGDIVVRLIRHEPDDLEVRIADTGRGMPAAPAGETNGLELMRNLAAQLGGTLDMPSGPGTTVVVRLKISG